MSRLHDDLQRLLADLRSLDLRFALVGGFAVGAWVEARSTRDVDVAVSVPSDAEAEAIVRALVARGYGLSATVEHTTLGRLATVRLVAPGGSVTDLLFCSSAVEAEVVATAVEVALFGPERVPVASIGALLAMKLLSVSPTRPRDQQDLVDLVRAAGAADLDEVRRLVRLIRGRGASRGRDLDAALSGLLALRHAAADRDRPRE